MFSVFLIWNLHGKEAAKLAMPSRTSLDTDGCFFIFLIPSDTIWYQEFWRLDHKVSTTSGRAEAPTEVSKFLRRGLNVKTSRRQNMNSPWMAYYTLLSQIITIAFMISYDSMISMMLCGGYMQFSGPCWCLLAAICMVALIFPNVFRTAACHRP